MNTTTFARLCFASVLTCSAHAQSTDSFLGTWASADGEGIVRFERCGILKDGAKTNLCGIVVWDRMAGVPGNLRPLDCNRLVAQFRRFEQDHWTEGVVFDPRTKKTYRATARLKNSELHLRAFIGSELFGETEVLTRVSQVPSTCEGKAPGDV